MSAFTPGMTLHDRYRLEEPIGAGAMAAVWRATDLVLGRGVAIKALDGKLARDAQLRAAARREAQAAAALNHPHITAVHDYGELPAEGGRVIPYLVLELLAGETLAHRLRGGPLPGSQAATIASQVAGALAAAHARGVIHHDIKPANIMLTSSGAKVLDFGTAVVPERGNSPDRTAGTPAYAPPERLLRNDSDPKSDVFSLAVTTYEMLTGHLPWPIETWEQAAVDHRPPPAFPSNIPAQVRAGLAMDPAARPTATAFAQAFGAGAGSAGVSAARDGQTPHGTKQLPAVVSPTLIGPAYRAGTARVPDRPTSVYQELPPAPPPRSRHMAAAFTTLVLLFVVGAIFIAAAMLQSGQNPQSNPPITPTPLPTSAQPSPTAGSTSDGDSVVALLAALENAVDLAIRGGAIGEDNADDFRSRVEDIIERQRRGRTNDLIKKAEDFRERIADKADDGEIDRVTAAALDAVLRQIISQARNDNDDG